jgi:hypothetical protein
VIDCKACGGRMIENEVLRRTLRGGREADTTYLYYKCQKCGAKRTNCIAHGGSRGHGRSVWKDGHVDDSGREIG